MSKLNEKFLAEAAQRDRLQSIAKALREGSLVRVGDSDYLMEPAEFETLSEELAHNGFRIAPTATCDVHMYMPDGKSMVGLIRTGQPVQQAIQVSAPEMKLEVA